MFRAFVALLLYGLVAQAAPPSFFIHEGSHRQSWTLEQLKKKLKVHTRTLKNPEYPGGREVTYEGFLFSEVLALLPQAAKNEDPARSLLFTCADGYQPSLPARQGMKGDWLLAFGEKGGGWLAFKQGKRDISPGPFYLIGTDSNFKEFPWPYQLVGVEWINFSAKYPNLYPKGNTSAEVAHGFEVFQKTCIKCHSINLQGGEMAPELNVPQNITEYRSEAFLRKFIQNPASFRARSVMPPANLSSTDLGNLLEYLRAMAKHKVKL